MNGCMQPTQVGEGLSGKMAIVLELLRRSVIADEKVRMHAHADTYT